METIATLTESDYLYSLLDSSDELITFDSITPYAAILELLVSLPYKDAKAYLIATNLQNDGDISKLIVECDRLDILKLRYIMYDVVYLLRLKLYANDVVYGEYSEVEKFYDKLIIDYITYHDLENVDMCLFLVCNRYNYDERQNMCIGELYKVMSDGNEIVNESNVAYNISNMWNKVHEQSGYNHRNWNGSIVWGSTNASTNKDDIKYVQLITNRSSTYYGSVPIVQIPNTPFVKAKKTYSLTGKRRSYYLALFIIKNLCTEFDHSYYYMCLSFTISRPNKYGVIADCLHNEDIDDNGFVKPASNVVLSGMPHLEKIIIHIKWMLYGVFYNADIDENGYHLPARIEIYATIMPEFPTLYKITNLEKNWVIYNVATNTTNFLPDRDIRSQPSIVTKDYVIWTANHGIAYKNLDEIVICKHTDDVDDNGCLLPASIQSHPTIQKIWYKYNVIHNSSRLYGDLQPALIDNGTCAYYCNGKKHNDDSINGILKPAVITANGAKSYFIMGKKINSKYLPD